MNALNFFFGRSTPESQADPANASTSSTPPTPAGPPPPPPKASANVKMPLNTMWNAPRAKLHIKLAIQRVRLLGTKKSQVAKVTRREIAGLLEKGRVETAEIKCEAVMVEDTMVELLEVLELYCELLLARFGLLESVREVDPGVAEAVCGIIHAAPRTELKELHVLRDMLMAKAGRDFSIAAIDNEDSCVSARITSKLAIAQPPADLVNQYLYEIAKAYAINWRPQGFPDPSATLPAATDIPTALTLPPCDPTTPSPTTLDASSTSPSKAPHPAALTPFPQTPPVDPPAAARTVIITTNLPAPPPSPGLAAPAPTTTTTGKKDEEEAFDALAKRFAELKKRS